MRKRPKLILASGSPRRKELLGAMGLEFTVQTSCFDEDAIHVGSGSVEEWVVTLAAGKALAVASQTSDCAIVIGADTTVVLDGECLGKPANADEASQMLRRLSGRTHTVCTGIAVIEVRNGVPGQPETDAVSTEVTFDTLTDEVIQAYVATGEPLDKAGAYGIQGKALAFIPRIEGDYFNVVGLPLHRLVALLKRFGLSVWSADRPANVH